jgi:hypothetical protein
VDAAALEGLKFSALLAPEVAAEELQARLADADQAVRVAEGAVALFTDSYS